METKEKHELSIGSLEELMSASTRFLTELEGDGGPGCEILLSEKVGGFFYSSNQLTHSLTKLVEAAAGETPEIEDLILTCTVTDEQRVHLSVVSPYGDFGGVGVDDIRRVLNSNNGVGHSDEVVKETPNTAFWRGGAPDEEADVLMEPTPFGGMKATLVIPAAKVAWRH